MRRVVLVAATTGLLVAATWGGASGTGGSGEGGSAVPTPTPTRATGIAELPPFTAPSDGGAVELIDSGVSVLVSGDGSEWLGYGFVVENTSGQVATDTRIRVDVVGESGEVLDTGEESTVRVLLPGQRFGAGEIAFSSEEERDRATALRVTIGGSLWYPPDTPGVAFPRLTALGETIDYVDDCEPTVAYTVRSQSSNPLDMRVDVTGVIRDGTGAIISGTGLTPFGPTEIRVAPGVTAQQGLDWVWDCPVPAGSNRDEATVELYLNPRGFEPAEED